MKKNGNLQQECDTRRVYPRKTQSLPMLKHSHIPCIHLCSLSPISCVQGKYILNHHSPFQKYIFKEEKKNINGYHKIKSLKEINLEINFLKGVVFE